MPRPPIALLASAILFALAGCASTPVPSPAPSVGASVDPGTSPAASASAGQAGETASAVPSAGPTVVSERPIAESGTIVVLRDDGTLSLVDADGTAVVIALPNERVTGFPAWSPDGSRLAVIRTGSAGSEIAVYEASTIRDGASAEATVVFRSPSAVPFYLSWTPDGRNVSFLASQSGLLSLRFVPAERDSPPDGEGTTVRVGEPLYYDWIAADRLLAHVGTGPTAFLGEIGLDGQPVSPAITSPGEFRSAVVSPDQDYVSYIRLADDGGSQVVVATRDASREQSMDVFGAAAVNFGPVAGTIASIGPSQPVPEPFLFPVGQLRLIDAGTGEVRMLLDGANVGFWWSPDGATIATLRVQAVPAPAPSAGPGPSGAPIGSPSTAPSGATQETEIRLLFVDVLSGTIRSERVVRLGDLFISQFITYFDQYALSHELWAPDSNSLLLPVSGSDGSTSIAVVPRDGDPPLLLDGAIGFWSP